MKFLSRIVATILFVIFFGFALKNTQEVALHFFLDYEIRGPLVLLLLGFFVAGGALGVLAMTPTVFRHRRELSNITRRSPPWSKRMKRNVWRGFNRRNLTAL